MTEIKNDNILRGYTSMERPYKVDGYPWGFKLKTSIHYWVESKPKFGDRMGTYTINPKTGKPCAPKYGNYSPFIYLYLDENGHVKHGIIDSYIRDEFKARFMFIIERIGEEFITDVQKQNIRNNHLSHVAANAPYDALNYSAEMKPAFNEWLLSTVKHIKTCEFKELVNYPDPPQPDNKQD